MRSNLEKLRIIRGNDMHPAISPSEYLLMDRSAPPKPGDVVVFENKFGCRVAHRLIHEIAGFYFTKGDNCPLFNFPFRRDRLLGVVMGKSRPLKASPVAAVLLAIFIPQFVVYSRLFDIRKKRYFLILSFASRHYPHTEAVEDG